MAFYSRHEQYIQEAMFIANNHQKEKGKAMRKKLEAQNIII